MAGWWFQPTYHWLVIFAAYGYDGSYFYAYDDG
jgi:hypothetical protein